MHTLISLTLKETDCKHNLKLKVKLFLPNVLGSQKTYFTNACSGRLASFFFLRIEFAQKIGLILLVESVTMLLKFIQHCALVLLKSLLIFLPSQIFKIILELKVKSIIVKIGDGFLTSKKMVKMSIQIC